MPHRWTCEPTRQIELLLDATPLRDYDLVPAPPWDTEPQPDEIARFEDEHGEIEVPLVTEDGDRVAIMWVMFAPDPDPDDDPVHAELRGWRLLPDWA